MPSVVKNIYDRHKPKLAVFGYIKHLPEWLESVRKLGYKQDKLDGNLFLVPAWFLINNVTREIVRNERGVSFFEHETFTSIYDSLTFKD